MKKYSALFILMISLSQPVQATNPMGDMMLAMMRMMAAMANHMAGSLGDSTSMGNSSAFNIGSNFGSGFNPWMSSWPGITPGSWPATGTGYPGMSPLGMPGTGYPGMGYPGMSPLGMPGMGSPWSAWPNKYFPTPQGTGYAMPSYPGWQQGAPGTYSDRGPQAISPIEGNWLSPSGEVLQVKDKRFRLRSQAGELSGTLRFDGNLLQLSVPQTGRVMPYRYIRKRGGLILQPPSGQALYFQQQPLYRY